MGGGDSREGRELQMEGRMLDIDSTAGHCTLMTVTIQNYNGSMSSRGAEQSIWD